MPADIDVDRLLEQARRGDRAALEQLLSHLAPAIHRFGMRMCRNVHDAEDVLQDTLINVAKHLDDFEGRSSLSSWVFALTRSACTRRRRGLKNQPTAGDEHLAREPDAARGPEENVAQQELADALSNALDRLSDEHREVIQLRDIEGLTALEAAETLGVSVDALKSRLHRAREALRGTLRPILEPAAARSTGACPDVVDLWSKKLEGDLSAGDCATMERHLAGCPSCTGACDALKRALVACQSARAAPVPPAIQERVRAAVRAWATPSNVV